MKLSEIFEIIQFNDKQNIREMSEEERAEYKKRKKEKRSVIVKLKLLLVLLIGIIVIFGVVLTVGLTKGNNKNKLTTNESETVQEDNGLKVTPGDVVADEPNTIEDEEVPLYSASETESTKSISSSEVISNYGIIINNDTNEIIATRNAYDRMVPASMTKVMTVYTAYKHMDQTKLDDKIVMSHEAVTACYASGCSTSGFVEGEEITVRDLFYGTILPSGGDAAAQLAIYVGGDMDSFMDLVNADLKELGLSETTHFTNPIGYYNDDHYSTVYDIAMIMKASLEVDFLHDVLSAHVYDSTPTNVNPEGITISNWFLRRIEDKDFGGEIIGAKTGYVNESGSCAVSCEKSDSGVTYICCTGKSSSSWNCIYDHVRIYNSFAE